MSKLSQTEFGTLLDLVSRTDLEQQLDVQQFIGMEPAGQSFVMRLLNQAKITRSIKVSGDSFVETPTHDTAGQKRRGGRVAKKILAPRGRVAKPLKILAPQGCKLDEEIPFSMEHFEKWLNQKGFKSSRTYVMGVNGLLKNVGMSKLTGITIFGLKSVRDSIADETKTGVNKRSWLKKFNQYVIFEYEHAQKIKE